MPPTDTCDRIVALLEAEGVRFDLLAHDPVRTAAEAASVREGSDVLGGKSLVMKLGGGGFVLVAVGGTRRMDNRALRRHLGVGRVRFATRAELAELTGLEPGAVPPFGRPIFDLPLHVDRTLADATRIGFTPGRHDRSIVMATGDWLRVARPAGIHALTTP